jgi:hypothetical protein
VIIAVEEEVPQLTFVMCQWHSLLRSAREDGREAGKVQLQYIMHFLLVFLACCFGRAQREFAT